MFLDYWVFDENFRGAIMWVLQTWKGISPDEKYILLELKNTEKSVVFSSIKMFFLVQTKYLVLSF